MILLLVILTITIKAYFDNKNWGNVDHAAGAFWVGVILLPACLLIGSLYPIWLFGLLWNPVINKVRGLPLFYMGDTARTDQILKKVFGNLAGEAFALIMLILLINALV